MKSSQQTGHLGFEVDIDSLLQEQSSALAILLVISAVWVSGRILFWPPYTPKLSLQFVAGASGRQEFPSG